MFARIVTMPLKPGSAPELKRAIENSVIPLLRKHKGFLDEIALVRSDGKVALGISFWDSNESAEAYMDSGYDEVMKALENVIDGPAHLQVFDVTNSTAHRLAAGLAA